jgi:hypothetical protein
MTCCSIGRTFACALVLLPGLANRTLAQCRPPSDSREAKLLAFYEAPLAFSALTAPVANPAARVSIGAELAPVPSAGSDLEHGSICFASTGENTRLTPVFGRPRLTVFLPGGISLEGSYIPPLTIGDATPNLGSLAIAKTFALPWRRTVTPLALMLRGHGTFGNVKGPITCSSNHLQQSSANDPCFGSSPSHDTFHPTMYGLESVLGASLMGGRLDAFGGAGVTWLRPRFQVNFTDGNGVTDNTRVEVNLQRLALLAGVTARVAGALGLTAEVYSIPEDVTTGRLGASYRLW